MLEMTGTVSARNMQAQLLDSMDLERERGITIKAQAVRMSLDYDGREYEVNLIDTPGHVDFSYEVSRSLAACEGALLVVDASQGIQAQTLANVYLAMEHDLTIIPVVNKIDLPAAEPGRVIEELSTAFGFQEDEVLRVSAKDGSGVRELLEAVIERVPPPQADAEKPLRALVFDSKYDSYKGVMAYVRVIDGQVTSADRVMMMATGTQSDLLEVGVFKPTMTKVSHLAAGEVGYLATGLKSVGQCRVGDTITLARGGAEEALPGYGEQKPMVFAGLYPSDGNEFHDLREALERLQMNDAALVYEPENSPALGPGFRCGFLGLLHMEIVQERLEREYGMDLVVTAPSVVYHVLMNNGTVREVSRPTDLPSAGEYERVEEPWLDISLLTPSRFMGPMMDLINSKRGEFKRTEYLDRAIVAASANFAAVVRPACRAGSAHPYGRGDRRFLRSGEDTEPWVRVARLLAQRLSVGAAGSSRYPGESGAGGRAIAHHASGSRLLSGADAGGALAEADPSSDVRGADSGGHRE